MADRDPVMDGGWGGLDLPEDDSGDRSAIARALFDALPPLYPHERAAMFAHTFDPASPGPPVDWCVPGGTGDGVGDVDPHERDHLETDHSVPHEAWDPPGHHVFDWSVDPGVPEHHHHHDHYDHHDSHDNHGDVP
ncbi:hypothetical protein KZZ52_17535 [Dactylosporangium sp. AC04546]|uniref:hypothetical protein n=1 Tax=Dactylosporangium sp. AC04546 TaxID=2862460 RepID=UPI002E7AFD7A|nr:hypothetical protein [Dactylosporangium sp. AC04546]WVK87101.1 hypothetical protein KZZ52_17535 [Dactylosporangium sp. AC04546]